MFRKKKTYEAGFDQDSYDNAARKLSNLSRRDLLYQLDQYLSELTHNTNAYQHNIKVELLLEMKRDLTTLMAIVDELHDELKAREASVRLLPY